MSLLLLITALFVIPAVFLIVIGDQTDPYKYAQGAISKSAREPWIEPMFTSLHKLGKDQKRSMKSFNQAVCLLCI